MTARTILSPLFVCCILGPVFAAEPRRVAATPPPGTQPAARLNKAPVVHSQGGGTVRVYPMRNTSAADVAKVVSETFGTAVRCVVAAPATNSLVLTMPEDMTARVEELIAQLDRASPKEDQAVTKLYELKHVEPGELARTLEEALPENIRIAAHDFSSSLIITGQPAAMALAEKLIAALDVPSPRSTMQATTIRLQHADAERVADVIRSVFDQTATADPATRRVIVRAPEETTKQILALVPQLDAAQEAGATERSSTDIRMYPLKYIAANDDLTRILHLAVQRRGREAAFALDRARRTVIVRGDASTLQAVGTLLAELDIPQESPAPKAQPALAAMRVRLVLLIGNPEEEMDLSSVPADLKPVVEELERIGVTDLGLAAQSVVEVTVGSFTLVASPVVAGAHELRLEGKLIDPSAERPQVQLTVQASRLPAPPTDGQPVRRVPSARQICSISTTVAAPPGHAVVLGMAPIEKSNWVFVLQLMPAP